VNDFVFVKWFALEAYNKKALGPQVHLANANAFLEMITVETAETGKVSFHQRLYTEVDKATCWITLKF
jgi:hypothetical protein